MSRVVVASFPTQAPIGGVAVQVDMVRMLVRAGVDAVLWLTRPLTADDWSYGPVPTIVGTTTGIGADDVLVLSELAIHPGADPAPGARKVVHNQNHFLTLASWPGDAPPPYSDWSPVPPVWTVSRESRDVLQAITRCDVRVVPPRVDYGLFAPQDKRPGTIALMPRKRPRHAEVLGRLLTAGAGPGDPPFEVRRLDGMTPRQVAGALATTTTFVALSRAEGLGLPVQEALACGCHVVGFCGGGGRDLFDAPSAHLIPDDCLTDLARTARELTVSAPQGAPGNRDWVLEHRAAAASEAALLDAVADARARPGAAASARHPETAFDHLPPDFFSAV